MSVEIVSWSEGNDGEVAKMLDLAAAGVIDLQRDGGWRVGDIRRITINSFRGGGGYVNASEDIDVVITSFSEYYNFGNLLQIDFMSCPSTEYRMTQNQISENSYFTSEMRDATLDALYLALPQWLTSRLKSFDVMVKNSGSDSKDVVIVTSNKIALRSTCEVIGSNPESVLDGRQIPYYAAPNNRIKTLGATDPESDTITPTRWWLRSPHGNNDFYLIDENGQLTYDNGSSRAGVAPFACLGGISSQPGDGIPIDSTNFPDSDFRYYIASNFDKDNDGKLSDKEISSIKSITIPTFKYKNITSLKGIELLPFVERIRIELKPKLAYIPPLGPLKDLHFLQLWLCPKLYSIDISENTKLKDLDISCSSITDIGTSSEEDKLDLTRFSEIETVRAGWYSITGEIELRTYPTFKSVDVTGCSNLKLLYIRNLYKGNNTEELIFGNLPNLEKLDCAGIKIESLDLTGCPKIKTVDAYDSPTLQEIYASGCTELTKIEVSWDNALSSIDVSRCTSLEELICQESNLNTLNIQDCTKLKYLVVNNNHLAQLDLQGYPELYNAICDHNDLTEINVCDSPKLDYLDCSYNQLESIDISSNVNMHTLVCSHNQLPQLDVSAAENLIILDCSNNLIESLVIGEKPKLLDLYCNSNLLTKLLITKCPSLNELRTHYNSIGSINIKGIKQLLAIYNDVGPVKVIDEDEPALSYIIYSDTSIQGEITIDASTSLADGSIKIVSRPKDAVINVNETANFKVVAIGDDLSYRWEKKVGSSGMWGELSSNSENNILQVIGSAENNNTYYRCSIYTSEDQIYSSSAHLTVRFPPSIVAQPQDQTVIEGSPVKFSLACLGTGLEYSWQYSQDGIAWSDIRNSNSLALNIVSSLSLNGYHYKCIVSNDLGTTTSDAATLTVTPDTSVSKPVIASQPSSTTVAEGSNATFAVTASGNDLHYQWQIFKSNQWQSITGETNSSFVVSATRMLDGNRYRCVVSNAAGVVYSNEATLTVSSGVYVSTPQVLTHPKSVNVDLGEVVTFWVRASGGSLTYQWQKFNNNSWYDITGAVGNTYTLTARAEIHNTRYRCIITNTAGSVYSNSAILSIRAGQDLSFYGYHSIIISGKNTYGEWEMYPTSRPHVAPPEVKTSYVDLPGADGGLDYTDLLTGEPRYGYRKGSWEFLLIPQDKWASTYRSLVSFLHGRQHTVILEDDPDYVYTGRLSVNEWQSAAHNSLITIDYILEPHARNISGEEEDAREAEILDAANELLSKVANTGMVIAKVAGGAALIDPSMLFEDGDNITY